MAARKNYTVSVPTSGLNVREEPDKAARVLRVIPNGERVAIDPEADTPLDWRALQGGGYVMAEYLE